MWLELRDTERRFGERTALDGLSFALAEGEIGCLLGPSGCGKTTALRCIAGLETLDGGTILARGRTLERARRARSAARARHRPGVPGPRAVPPPHGARQRRVRPARAGAARATRARRGDARAGRARRLCRRVPRATVRRPAAACRGGARARAASLDATARRAVLEPRRGAARAPGRRTAHAAQVARRHGAGGHPRPAGCLRARRPRRPAARWPPRAMGHALRSLPPPGVALRSRVRRAGVVPAGLLRRQRPAADGARPAARGSPGHCLRRRSRRAAASRRRGARRRGAAAGAHRRAACSAARSSSTRSSCRAAGACCRWCRATTTIASAS